MTVIQVTNILSIMIIVIIIVIRFMLLHTRWWLRYQCPRKGLEEKHMTCCSYPVALDIIKFMQFKCQDWVQMYSVPLHPLTVSPCSSDFGGRHSQGGSGIGAPPILQQAGEGGECAMPLLRLQATRSLLGHDVI